MSTTNIIRAWKDPEYRESLSEAELAALPQNPVGLVELAEDELETAAGARTGLFNMCRSASPSRLCEWEVPGYTSRNFREAIAPGSPVESTC